MVEIPRIVHWTVVRDDGGAAIGKLVHVELAEEHRTRIAQLLHHRRIDGGHTVGVYRTGGGGPYTRRIDIVLEGDGNAMQWSARAPCRGLDIQRPRLRQSLFGGDGD